MPQKLPFSLSHFCRYLPPRGLIAANPLGLPSGTEGMPL
jgi:hypothetical protein